MLFESEKGSPTRHMEVGRKKRITMIISAFMFWMIFAVLVGVYAGSKGRSGVGFFFLSFLVSPLVGLLIALLSSPNQEKMALDSNQKKCPACAEFVKSEAQICRFCRFQFPVIAPKSNPTSARFETQWRPGLGDCWYVVRYDPNGKQLWVSDHGFSTRQAAEEAAEDCRQGTIGKGQSCDT
jgi:hypothetical protein